MAPLTTAARTLAQSTLRSTATLSCARTLSTSSALRDASGAAFQSPFKGETKGSKVPDFSHYLSNNSKNSNVLFGYFMVGTMGAISAAGAKSTIQGE